MDRVRRGSAGWSSPLGRGTRTRPAQRAVHRRRGSGRTRSAEVLSLH